MIQHCRNCSKNITNEDQYTITVLDYRGSEHSIWCCSEECCLEVRENNAKNYKEKLDFINSRKPVLFIKKM